jgi:hypothetical protein
LLWPLGQEAGQLVPLPDDLGQLLLEVDDAADS